MLATTKPIQLSLNQNYPFRAEQFAIPTGGLEGWLGDLADLGKAAREKRIVTKKQMKQIKPGAQAGIKRFGIIAQQQTKGVQRGTKTQRKEQVARQIAVKQAAKTGQPIPTPSPAQVPMAMPAGVPDSMPVSDVQPMQTFPGEVVINPGYVSNDYGYTDDSGYVDPGYSDPYADQSYAEGPVYEDVGQETYPEDAGQYVYDDYGFEGLGFLKSITNWAKRTINRNKNTLATVGAVVPGAAPVINGIVGAVAKPQGSAPAPAAPAALAPSPQQIVRRVMPAAKPATQINPLYVAGGVGLLLVVLVVAMKSK